MAQNSLSYYNESKHNNILALVGKANKKNLNKIF
jgi:hypothetical protein